MALFYPLTQGVPPELMSIFKLKSASGAHFQHTWTHFMQNSRKNLTFYIINIIYYLFTKFCTTALFAPTTSITAELSGIKEFSQPKISYIEIYTRCDENTNETFMRLS